MRKKSRVRQTPETTAKPQFRQRNLTKTVTFRLAPKLRDMIVAGAREAGKAISVEITDRLEASYLGEQARDKEPHLWGLALAVAELAQRVEKKTGKHWHEDAATAKALVGGMPMLLQDCLCAMPPLPAAEQDTPRSFGQKEAGMLCSQLNMLKALPPGTIKHLRSITTGAPLTASWPVHTHRLYEIIFNTGRENM